MIGCFDTYGFEYLPGADGYITWVSEGKASWTMLGAGLGPDLVAEIGQRPIPEEPMHSAYDGSTSLYLKALNVYHSFSSYHEFGHVQGLLGC